jgi:hypothetical protein
LDTTKNRDCHINIPKNPCGLFFFNHPLFWGDGGGGGGGGGGADGCGTGDLGAAAAAAPSLIAFHPAPLWAALDVFGVSDIESQNEKNYQLDNTCSCLADSRSREMTSYTLGPSLISLQKDWDNREFIQTIQFSVQKMVEFLNKFGTLPVDFLTCRIIRAALGVD